MRHYLKFLYFNFSDRRIIVLTAQRFGDRMLIEYEDAQRLKHMADRRTGVLQFTCDTLGSFQGLDIFLASRWKEKYWNQFRQALNAKPGFMQSMLEAIGGDFGSSVGEAHNERMAKVRWENVRVLCGDSRFQRAVADLDDKELALLSASAAHVIALYEREDLQQELLNFLYGINARIVWAGGNTQYVPPDIASQYPMEAAAARDLSYELMQHFICADPHAYRQDIGDLLGQFVSASQSPQYAQAEPRGATAVSEALQGNGSAWASATDLDNGRTPFKRFQAGQDMFLGMLECSEGSIPVGFAGNESLVTVAQPGAGKTQCHILTNLMTYDGPLVVLDPKLELLELTAGLRQSEGKHILVLNLADDDVETHRFNVLDFVDRRPEFMWGNLVELSEFLLPPTPNDNSPIFRAKAVELFAVCLGGEILEGIEAERVPTLSKAIRRIFAAPETLMNWLYDTELRAQEAGCEPLEQSAVSLAALANNPNTLEDFQRYQSNATSVLTKFRGGVIDRVANGEGDWKPEDLREPGCTLYIRVPYEEMTVYGGFVRMVLYTIIRRLRRGPTEHSELPVTFLLDEVAQLGNLDQIANVVETGRGYGLRLWMILQDYDQAKAATSKPNLILKTPKIRLFMNPTLETAQDMSAELGKINQVITGKDKPLAEPSELMGERYAASIVALSSGSKPFRLRKHFAWEEENYTTLTEARFRFNQ